MTRQEKKKSKSLYDALLKRDINPEKIIRNPLFIILIQEYLEGINNLEVTVLAAVKINILSGGKFTEPSCEILIA